MARVKLSDELKKAISGISSAQKDKLLFRLIAGNPALAEKLVFELLEGGETAEERRALAAKEIEKRMLEYQARYYSPGILLRLMRDLSGMINRHVATTRDRYGEVELNLLMLNLAFEYFGDKIRKTKPQKAQRFNEYVVKRTLKLLGLIDKMHEDLRLDFKKSLQTLAQHIANQSMTKSVAETYGLQLNWLL